MALDGVERLHAPGFDGVYGASLRGGFPLALRMVALFSLTLALARPRLVHREVVVESEGLDIMVAVDTSGSMDARDLARPSISYSRLDVAKGLFQISSRGVRTTELVSLRLAKRPLPTSR